MKLTSSAFIALYLLYVQHPVGIIAEYNAMHPREQALER